MPVVVYNAEVDRLKNLIHKARLSEFLIRTSPGEDGQIDRERLIEAVKMRKNAQAELALLTPPPFNGVRITK